MRKVLRIFDNQNAQSKAMKQIESRLNKPIEDLQNTLLEWITRYNFQSLTKKILLVMMIYFLIYFMIVKSEK